jgi:hypothetical protein
VETGTAWRAPTRRGACYFILPAISRVILLVFLLVSAAIDEENYFTFRWLWQSSSIGQGHQPKLLRSFGWQATLNCRVKRRKHRANFLFSYQTANSGVVARLDRAIQYSRDGSSLYETSRRTGCPA